MSKQSHPFWVIAHKDIRDALHDRFIILVTGFLMLASLTALTVAAIALHTDVATYTQAVQTLLALGKSADMLAAPEFYPLRLLRGFVEHTEIIGAVLGILLGYRAAASERPRTGVNEPRTEPGPGRAAWPVGLAPGGGR